VGGGYSAHGGFREPSLTVCGNLRVTFHSAPQVDTSEALPARTPEVDFFHCTPLRPGNGVSGEPPGAGTRGAAGLGDGGSGGGSSSGGGGGADALPRVPHEPLRPLHPAGRVASAALVPGSVGAGWTSGPRLSAPAGGAAGEGLGRSSPGFPALHHGHTVAQAHGHPHAHSHSHASGHAHLHPHPHPHLHHHHLHPLPMSPLLTGARDVVVSSSHDDDSRNEGPGPGLDTVSSVGSVARVGGGGLLDGATAPRPVPVGLSPSPSAAQRARNVRVVLQGSPAHAASRLWPPLSAWSPASLPPDPTVAASGGAARGQRGPGDGATDAWEEGGDGAGAASPGPRRMLEPLKRPGCATVLLSAGVGSDAAPSPEKPSLLKLFPKPWVASSSSRKLQKRSEQCV
jgi:hypothetical protein